MYFKRTLAYSGLALFSTVCFAAPFFLGPFSSKPAVELTVEAGSDTLHRIPQTPGSALSSPRLPKVSEGTAEVGVISEGAVTSTDQRSSEPGPSSQDAQAQHFQIMRGILREASARSVLRTEEFIERLVVLNEEQRLALRSLLAAYDPDLPPKEALAAVIGDAAAERGIAGLQEIHTRLFGAMLRHNLAEMEALSLLSDTSIDDRTVNALNAAISRFLEVSGADSSKAWRKASHDVIHMFGTWKEPGGGREAEVALRGIIPYLREIRAGLKQGIVGFLGEHLQDTERAEQVTELFLSPKAGMGIGTSVGQCEQEATFQYYRRSLGISDARVLPLRAAAATITESRVQQREGLWDILLSETFDPAAYFAFYETSERRIRLVTEQELSPFLDVVQRRQLIDMLDDQTFSESFGTGGGLSLPAWMEEEAVS